MWSLTNAGKTILDGQLHECYQHNILIAERKMGRWPYLISLHDMRWILVIL